jgi:hypothetical protein
VFRTDGQSDQYWAFATMWRIPDNLLHVIVNINASLKSRSQNFHFMGPLYEVYISQMIRYSRACGSSQDFLDIGLLLTRKLLIQGFLIPLQYLERTRFSVVHKKSLKIPKGHSETVRVSGSCSTSGTRRVNLVTNPVISREWGKDREVFKGLA